jgi:hypothetical protein
MVKTLVIHEVPTRFGRSEQLPCRASRSMLASDKSEGGAMLRCIVPTIVVARWFMGETWADTLPLPQGLIDLRST